MAKYGIARFLRGRNAGPPVNDKEFWLADPGAFDELPPDVQQVIRDCWGDIGTMNVRLQTLLWSQYSRRMEELREKIFRALGVKRSNLEGLTPEELLLFQEGVRKETEELLRRQQKGK